ncbi:MAG: sigma-70 family RNA polymerase sigma factor [Bacteroidetes bacterium]|nr:sigma-70 family RNA polymerase sigma factor [Bacteroidota bacterium]
MQTEISDSSTTIIDRIKQDDQHAFTELYDNYSSMLYGIITRIVPDEEDAANLLQDSFVKVWANINSYNPSKGRFATWLINIARHTSIDFIRSKYYTQKKQTQALENIVSYGAMHNKTYLAIDTIGIKNITEKLNPLHKQIIDWIYFEGYTQQEIADKFGIPLGTIKTRARAAMIDLRNYFETSKK